MPSDDTSSNGLLKVGIIGTIIVALCCFTPILVILFGAIGLAAVVGYLDLVLFPALGIFFPTDHLRALAEERARLGILRETGLTSIQMVLQTQH